MDRRIKDPSLEEKSKIRRVVGPMINDALKGKDSQRIIRESTSEDVRKALAPLFDRLGDKIDTLNKNLLESNREAPNLIERIAGVFSKNQPEINIPKLPEKIKAIVDFPKEQKVKGVVNVDNFPKTQQVTGEVTAKVDMPRGEGKEASKKAKPYEYMVVRLTDGQQFITPQASMSSQAGTSRERVWLREEYEYTTVSGTSVPTKVTKWNDQFKLTEEFEYNVNAEPVIKSRNLEPLPAGGIGS